MAWTGAVYGGDYDVYVNQTNISADLLGPGRSARSWGFTDAGLPIWFGWGSLVPNGALFVGRTNMGLEAFGSTSPWPSQWGAVGNARGDVLWWTQFSVGGQKYNELWLSTLVPEPGGLGAICIGAAAVGLSQRRRRR